MNQLEIRRANCQIRHRQERQENFRSISRAFIFPASAQHHRRRRPLRWKYGGKGQQGGGNENVGRDENGGVTPAQDDVQFRPDGTYGNNLSFSWGHLGVMLFYGTCSVGIHLLEAYHPQLVGWSSLQCLSRLMGSTLVSTPTLSLDRNMLSWGELLKRNSSVKYFFQPCPRGFIHFIQNTQADDEAPV